MRVALLAALVVGTPALAAKPLRIGAAPVDVGDHGTADGRLHLVLVGGPEPGEVDVHEVIAWEVLEPKDGPRVRMTWTEQTVASDPAAGPKPGPYAGKTVVLGLVGDELQVVGGDVGLLLPSAMMFTGQVMAFATEHREPSTLVPGESPPATFLPDRFGPGELSATVVGLRKVDGRRVVVLDTVSTVPGGSGTVTTLRGQMWVDPRSGHLVGYTASGEQPAPDPTGEGAGGTLRMETTFHVGEAP